MKTNVVIFAKTQEFAELILEELLLQWGEQPLKITKDVVETETKYIRARKWHDNLRGIKAHELWIDNMLDPEMIKTSIISCLRQNVEIWEDRDINWNWKEHVHYF